MCFDRNCAILLNREQAEPFTRSLGETVDLLHESERWQLRSLRRMYVPGSACDQFEENFMLLQNGGTYTRLNVNISVVQRDDRGGQPCWPQHCNPHSAARVWQDLC